MKGRPWRKALLHKQKYGLSIFLLGFPREPLTIYQGGYALRKYLGANPLQDIDSELTWILGDPRHYCDPPVKWSL
jgi:hypothetical protein